MLRVTIVAFLLGGLAACETPWQSSAPPPSHPYYPVVRITAHQAARAMGQDRFFADYGQTTLLIRGTVLSLDRHDHDTAIELGTGLPAGVICDLGNRRASARDGDAITVESLDPGRDAVRDSSGVMIRKCRVHWT